MPWSFSTKLHWTIYCRSPPAEFARPFLRHVWPKFWHSRKLRFWYSPIPNLPKNDAFFGFKRTSISNCNLRLKQSLQIRRVDNESKVGKTCSNLQYQDTSGKVLEFPFPTLIWKELICLWFVDPCQAPHVSIWSSRQYRPARVWQVILQFGWPNLSLKSETWEDLLPSQTL